MKTLLDFFLRHLLTVPALALVLSLLWVVVYYVLLLLGHMGDLTASPDGASALTAGLLFIVLCTLMIGWGIFAPACGLGLLVTRLLRRSRYWAIPIVWATASLIAYACQSAYYQQHPAATMPTPLALYLQTAAFLTIPLAIYWWLTEGLLLLPAALHRRAASASEA